MLQMPIHYTSFLNSEPLQLKISGKNDYTNEHSEMVSVGYFLAKNGAISCVAVSLISARDTNGSDFFAKSRDIMHKIQQRLPKSKRKFLIEMIDAGYTTPYGERALITELGEESFNERLYGRRSVLYASDAEMISVISDLAQPLVEFHKSPTNFMYVKNDGNLVLKLVDFEDAQFFLTSFNQNESAAVRGVREFSPEYTAPEYYDEMYGQISTKFDIWSVGIIAFEIFIDQLRLEEKKAPMNGMERRTMLCNIGNLFFGFKRNRFGDYPGNVKEVPLLYSEDPNWVWQNSDAIHAVLRLWLKFPKTALLITNLLDFRQEKRLTAQGVLDFTNGLCFHEELKTKLIEEMGRSVAMKFGECETE
ncbi:hypothetical protein niasHT_020943 [Heterodera trifolii]|uniref:Protein kinase domain-containing protein n=1 Tax=Heterodera trifolii TaxID=157864 RepID=A0ABD2KCL7_9BILA